MGNRFSGIQQLGRALMLPIAVLPVAGLLLRLGQADLLDIPFIAAAGGAVFDNLGLLFAIGVAVGFAKENHGSAGLAGAVGFVIAIGTTKTLLAAAPGMDAALAGKEIGRVAIPAGIVMGILAGWLYNKYNAIKLPEWLAFFGGRRFVPIVTGFSALFIGLILGYFWPHITKGLDALTWAVLGSGEFGLFIYGVLNRLLIVTGLHHVVNSVAWFTIGSFEYVKDGAVLTATGDLNRFFADDPTAGAFMAGFFPIMMFGLPGACLAMFHTATPARRAAVGGLLFSMALTAFLTGVTEPIEFAFMFLAPFLYAIHAVLTGLSLVVMSLLDVKLGFTFSAGMFDYLINFTKATNPLYLLPVGAVFFVLYYAIFRFVIVKFNLKTPGRADEEEAPAAAVGTATGTEKAERMIEAMGGAANLKTVEACTTRLRCDVVDSGKVNDAALRALDVRGIVKPSPQTLQVIIGPTADILADEIKAVLKKHR